MATVLNPDEPYSTEWGVALESLQQFENHFGVLELLADAAPVHDWVRVEIRMWLEGKRPPWPKKEETDEDRKLREAAQACRDKANWVSDEGLGNREEDRIRRIAKARGIKPASLENYYNGKGRAYHRGTPWRKWRRVYTETLWSTEQPH